MKTFRDLKDDQIIVSEDGDKMKVVFYDFYGTGENVMCFESERSIYPETEFYADDWEVVK